MAAKPETPKPEKAEGRKSRAGQTGGAKSKAATGAGAAGGGPRGGDITQRVIDAALNLASERDWRDIALRDIAEAAGEPLSAVYSATPSKSHILAAYARRIDAEVLAEDAGLDPEDSARDRLFDVLMRRFDVMQPDRKAVAGILYDTRRDACALLGGAVQLGRSMDWMLEAAGLGASGLRGVVRRKALAGVYLATLRVWLKDDTEDMARTMSALDKNLRRLEQAAGMLRRGRRRRPGGSEAADAPEGAAGQSA